MDDNRGQSDINSKQKGSPHGMVNNPLDCGRKSGIALWLKVNLQGKQIVNICRQTQQQYISIFIMVAPCCGHS